MNLCLNAAEAITERINQQPAGKGTGEIAITVRDTQLRNQFEVFGANNEPLSGKFVLVQVKDDGTGMDETTLRRIFEPFFTTKFTGRGLGLAAVIGIIQNHGGGLHVTSKPGQGSTFSVYLPATRSYATPIEEQAPPLSLEGSETVLIIDDEAVARQLGLLTLANLGYQVLLAASGEEGLETYRQYQGQIGLVILDLTMQGLGGEEVLAELAMMDQPVPVLLTSGYDENMAGERAGSRYTTGFLQKPYTPEVLAKAVREVLDKSK
jgi:CheY-like chemotaxis protein